MYHMSFRKEADNSRGSCQTNIPQNFPNRSKTTVDVSSYNKTSSGTYSMYMYLLYVNTFYILSLSPQHPSVESGSYSNSAAIYT